MQTIDLQSSPNPDQISVISDWLAGAGYRVIRPLEERQAFREANRPERLITVAILDTETTGTHVERDRLIELGMVLVEICPESGQAFRITHVFSELEDPGIPIPEESTRIHHITNEMVKGKRIVDEEVQSLMENVSLVVAHNAEFDRGFVEKRFPIFETKAWACSLRQVPWSEEGISSAKLEFLAYHYGFQFTAHRASTDCRALLEVLQQPLPMSGSLAMNELLKNAREPEMKVSALGSPFETKDLLRERGYRWNADKRVWARSVQSRTLDDETAWLKKNVYGGNGFKLELENVTSENRFSARQTRSEIVAIDQ